MSDAVDFADPVRSVRLSMIGGRGHYEAVVKAALEAKVSLWIATANLKELRVEASRIGRRSRYESSLAALDRLAERGVELRILHGGFPSRAFREAFDAHPRLIEGGLQMRQCPRVHLKAVIVDGRRLYLGSANWTGAGLGAKGDRRRNFELGLWTEDEALLDQIQALFEHLWRGEECARCGRRDVCDDPIA